MWDRSEQAPEQVVERAVASVLVVVVCAALSCGAACAMFPWPPHGSRTDQDAMTFASIAQRVEIWELRKKRLPASLEEVYGPDPVPRDGVGGSIWLDVPGRCPHFDLVGFGADDRPGGVGERADHRWSDHGCR
jgi:hypothetical protein